MENIESIKKLSQISDRQLLEFILANQIQIFRRIKDIEFHFEIDKGERDDTFIDSFKSLYDNSRAAIEQISDELKNQ